MIAAVSSVVVAALVGVCLGFLPLNFHPARIFMGDSGAYMLGDRDVSRLDDDELSSPPDAASASAAPSRNP